uniref:Carotenoid-cleaving dioxygenase, mitochondrial n=1 Tax=Meretrix meretrix TaxID=291251 RepID=A0A1L1ZNP6_MERMT|nr:carotene and beta,beta-carotene 9',10'-oxygenase [Meretrix meretrix]
MSSEQRSFSKIMPMEALSAVSILHEQNLRHLSLMQGIKNSLPSPPQEEQTLPTEQLQCISPLQTVIETPEPCKKDIKGHIPGVVWEHCGAGKFEFGEEKYNHHVLAFQFQLRNGTVQCLQSKFLQSLENNQHNRIVSSEFEFGTTLATFAMPDDNGSVFAKPQGFNGRFDPPSDNANVSSKVVYNGQVDCQKGYVTTEQPNNCMYKVTPDPELETLEKMENEEKVDWSKFVAVNGTAHPHYAPDDQTAYNMGNSYKFGTTYIEVVPPETVKSPTNCNCDNETVEGAKPVLMESPLSIAPTRNGDNMKPSKASYYHSYHSQASENYIIEKNLEQRITTSKFERTGKPISLALAGKPTTKPRFRVIDKKTGAEIHPNVHYETDTFMFMHHINTYEDKGHIVMDIIAYKKDSVLQYLYLKELTTEECEKEHRKIEDPEPRRYVIPIKLKSNAIAGTNLVSLSYTKATARRRDAKTVFLTHEILAHTGIEFPQINYRQYNTKKYRYVYGVGWHSKGDIIHTLLKIDTETKTFKQWKSEKCFPSEPVFVPRPAATTEDDGVLLSAICRTDFDEKDGGNAFLLILDAKTMLEIARADFGVPRFPKDLHGLFTES